MLLSDFLKGLGVEPDPLFESPPKLSSGVRFLLLLLSRRYTHGKSVSFDETLLKSDWLSSIPESFEQSLQDAIAAKYVQSGPTGYSLTALGKSVAH